LRAQNCGTGPFYPQIPACALGPGKNIENNPMQRNKSSLAWILSGRKRFDTSGKSPALLQHSAIVHARTRA
jgi:hypothetical protein